MIAIFTAFRNLLEMSLSSKMENQNGHSKNKIEFRNFLSETNGLWMFQSTEEMDANVTKWNEKQSKVYPHCQICSLFNRCQTSTTTTTTPGDELLDRLPRNSEIFIPEICFTKKTRTRSRLPSKSDFNDENIDCLLTCRGCKLTVHQSCYHGNMDESLVFGDEGCAKNQWLCDKCQWRRKNPTAKQEPSCCMCLLHGGALKQTDEIPLRWAHVVCALCIGGVSFKYPSIRAAIHIPTSLLGKERKLLKRCIYCDAFTHHQADASSSLTVKCDVNYCKNRFHITCGHVYGNCQFDQADWPQCISILCHEHAEKVNFDQIDKKVSF